MTESSSKDAESPIRANAPPTEHVLKLEEKLTFIEHELETVQSLVEEIFKRLGAIEQTVHRHRSDFEDRIAGLESPPPADEPPPPHWGRARPE